MFKQSLLLLSVGSITLSGFAQTGNTRYKDLVFPAVTVSKDLSYAPSSLADEKKSYLFDLYQPKNDQVTGRPMIIWMHGGGFKFGTKEARGIQLWSKTFAQRGYVCAAINYRLSKKNPLLHFGELKKSSYYAVQDAKMAVDYFRNHYKEYNIDPDKIILGGNSAGGMIALQAAYASNPELAISCGLPDTVQGATSKELFKVAGVINYWGGIYDLEWLKNTRVPIVSVLGNKDGLVKPTNNNNVLYGGIDIHAKADSLHIPNRLKIFGGYAHELQKHFNPLLPPEAGTQKRWLEAGQFAADFLYKTL
jgi:dienelactone hydrolase